MIDKNNIYENEIKKEGNETLICKEKENQNIIETQQSDLTISDNNINLDKKAQKKNKSIELKEQSKIEPKENNNENEDNNIELQTPKGEETNNVILIENNTNNLSEKTEDKKNDINIYENNLNK